jgi:hypothetical protein
LFFFYVTFYLGGIMYELYHVGDLWQIHTTKDAFEGGKQNIVDLCIRDLGFELEELNLAFQEMEARGDDAAHFGIQRRLIFTYNRKRERFH